MKRSLVSLIASLLASVAVAEVPPAVQELVFSARLVNESNDFVYCLSVDDEDVGLNVLARLSRTDLTLVVASECTQAITGSVHNSSGRNAMFLRLLDFSSAGGETPSVEFETYHNGRNASGETIQLKFLDGTWRIVGIFRAWIA